MYQKGDKIVYPLYGAGIIEDIEEKEIDGELQKYYVLHIPVGSLKIMISVAKSDSLGVRDIYDKDTLLEILNSTLARSNNMPDNWNQRYKENMERIKKGSLSDVAHVYHNLLIREREKVLSTAEKKMMTTSKQILLSELILSFDIEKVEAETMLDNIFG